MKGLFDKSVFNAVNIVSKNKHIKSQLTGSRK